MDVSRPARTLKTTGPQTLLQTLEEILGKDVYLLRHLPQDMVVALGPDDVVHGYVASRIEFGTTKDEGKWIQVYAYMSKFSRQRNLPEINLRGRRRSGAWKSFRLEHVVARGELHTAFEPVKKISTSAMRTLLQCLFMVSGATFPSDCALFQSFQADVRTVCYRYKNAHDALNDRKAMAAPKSPSVPDSSVHSGVSPTTRKRRFSSLSTPLPMSDSPDTADMATSPGRLACSAVTSPADPALATDSIAAGILVTPHDGTSYLAVQRNMVQVEAELNIVTGKTAAPDAESMAGQHRWVDTLYSKLRAQHNDENSKLGNTHKSELEQLKTKQAAEERALHEKQTRALDLVREEIAEAESESKKKRAALIEERNAKLQEMERLEAACERELKKLIATPGWLTAINKAVRDQMVAKRTSSE